MRWTLGVLPLLLSACATQKDISSPSGGERVSDAASTPLSDLNLVRAEIPPALVEAQKAPYRLPEAGCATVGAELAQLEAVLGADLDVPPSASRPSLIERGGTTVGDAAVGALRGAAEGVVPLRSWVRKLTGAERYSKEVAAAIAAGTVRRSYLKGVGQSRGCPPPAAPALAASAP